MKSIDKRFQQLLKDLDLYSGRIDGIQGPNTTVAIKRFQQLNGLSVDGILGPITREAMRDQLEPIQDRQQDIVNEDVEYGYKRWPKETMDSLHNFYGSVGENQTSLELPYQMVLAWDTSYKINKFSCHKLVADSLYAVLEDVKKAYTHSEIKQHGFDLFGGCLNVRKIRGGNRWSTHAWGIAVDFDPARNRLKTPWDQAYLSRPECADFVNAFKNQGWYSLGLERNYDAMHFQACWR